MKFEYEASSEDWEVVACIDDRGDLAIRFGSDVAVIYSDGSSCTFEHHTLKDVLEGAAMVEKFYKGDSITITF